MGKEFIGFLINYSKIYGEVIELLEKNVVLDKLNRFYDDESSHVVLVQEDWGVKEELEEKNKEIEILKQKLNAYELAVKKEIQE